MVKWLEEITVTEGESDNFYHFHDNRVLPSHVTEALAKKEGVPPDVCPWSVDIGHSKSPRFSCLVWQRAGCDSQWLVRCRVVV